MKVKLDLRLSVEENANRYFEAAKKARKKSKGAEKALVDWKARLAKEKEQKVEKRIVKKQRKREWFERFRWCYSSQGLLLIGGRDATTNDILIKKYAEKDDIVFHTDMAGSPFVIIKTEKQKVSSETMEEAATMTATFSRAWKNGLSALEVFHVAPEQVTKEANPGEYLGKGAFMIRGKTTYHQPALELAVGLDKEGRVVAGPPTAIAANCEKSVTVLQGREKTSDVAKQLQKLLGGGDLDEFIAALPAGGCKVR